MQVCAARYGGLFHQDMSIPPIQAHISVVHSVRQGDMGICEIHKENFNQKYNFVTIYFYNLVI